MHFKNVFLELLCLVFSWCLYMYVLGFLALVLVMLLFQLLSLSSRRMMVIVYNDPVVQTKYYFDRIRRIRT